jgi:hypothetical protein
VTLVGVVALVVLLAGTTSTSEETSGAESVNAVLPPPTVKWLQNNVPEGARLLASAELAPVLRRSLPGRDVIADSQAAQGQEAADLVLVSATLKDLPEDHVAYREARRATTVATFGDGALEVRQTSGGDRVATAKAAEAAGRDLSRVLSVRLTPAAWATLVDGDVDPRLMTVLGRMAEDHTIDVAAFERDAATRNADGPARTAVVRAAGGDLVSRSGFSVRALIADLEALPDDLRPAKVRIERRAEEPVLVISYLLPAEALS